MHARGIELRPHLEQDTLFEAHLKNPPSDTLPCLDLQATKQIYINKS